MSKNRIQYDLNASFGLMPIIQSLIKPPDSSESNPKITLKKSSHSYYKKPGRGHNNDSCDSCGEGGDLICCDRCPSSFHLGCHDPPLDEHKIPYGLWICHTCKMKDSSLTLKYIKLDKIASKCESHDCRENQTELLQTFKNKKIRVRSNSCKSSPDMIGMEKVAKGEGFNNCQQELDISTLSPMDQLIRAARILNPRQFDLPRELKVYFPFPGTEKLEGMSKINGNGKKGGKGKRVYELDSQGLVPLPAKTCNTCGRSCRKAPLIACDYCDSFYHQDCLDPPLTALPTAMWMCPNHVEQFIDWKLVNSVSATERIKLWNQFNTVIDQDSIKNEFFRKVSRRNPPFRIKQKAVTRDYVEVPSIIEYHYKNPSVLFPSMREILRTRDTDPNKDYSQLCYDDTQILMMIDAELKAIGAADNRMNEIDKKTMDPKNKERKLITETEEQIETANGDTAKGNGGGRIEKQIPSSRKIPASKSLKGEEQIVDSNILKSPLESEYVEERRTKHIDLDGIVEKQTDVQKVNDVLSCFDSTTVKTLAFQRLQQILISGTIKLDNFPKNMEKADREIVKVEDFSLPLPSQLLTKDDIERIAKEFTSPKRENEATDNQLNDLGAVSKRVDIKQNFTDEFLTDHQKICLLSKNVKEIVRHKDIRTRAVITPIDIKIKDKNWFETPDLSLSCYMRYRSLSVGSGQGNDVQLTKYGNCQYISDKHATIFYDEVTRMYELLNYSEFGTVVNGQHYTCDFTNYAVEKEYTDNSHTAAKKSKKEDCDDSTKDRKFSKQKIRQEISSLVEFSRKCNYHTNNLSSNIRMASISQPKCTCPQRSLENYGWEGTALLYHGTLLQFGCLSFVFSITDYDCIAEEFEETDNQSDDDI
ncbi:PHD finger protein 12 [Wyeomyia smithii]|uniref:PHD finger protein 12 n=1 Tax=Wyeomyia smithii TaxID=174621 RepID=UPI002467ADF0|nr:PHD finger protein 12 [Wyeomyia smithii]